MSRDVVFVLAITGLIIGIGGMLLRPEVTAFKLLFGGAFFALSYSLRTNATVQKVGLDK